MKPLDRYQKAETVEKVKQVTTSVNVTTEQKKFLEENNLNLSAIVRDAIDELRKQKGVL